MQRWFKHQAEAAKNAGVTLVENVTGVTAIKLELAKKEEELSALKADKEALETELSNYKYNKTQRLGARLNTLVTELAALARKH